MAEATQGADGGPFDVSRIRQLVRLMRENEISEIDLRLDNSRIHLRRGGDYVVGTAPAIAAPVAAPSAVALPTVAAASASTAKPEADNSIVIKSPIVGTFYSASSPDTPAFATVGTRVTPDTIVCIVEAMKVFNEIPAGVAGVITEVLVENNSPVEYNQHLFRVKP